MPPDRVFNDVVARYFDSSTDGLYKVFNCANRDQHEEGVGEHQLTKKGLLDACTEHLAIFNGSEESKKCFERVCSVLELPCSRATFAYAIRRIRIGMLLSQFGLEGDNGSSGQIYHFDYDDDNIFTKHPFNVHRTSRRVEYEGKRFNVPCAEKQEPVADIGEYLYTSKRLREGRTRWVHMHHPSTELLLAVGQVYRMPGHVQDMLCNLKGCAPQFFPRVSSQDREEPDLSGDEARYRWSSLVFPGIYLDRRSRESLQGFNEWISGRQDPRKRHRFPAAPPPVRVACVELTLGVLWSEKEANTLMSACTESYYLGKWMSDDPSHAQKSIFQSFLDFLTCSSCYDRADGYEEVPQTDPDDLESATESTRFARRQTYSDDLESSKALDLPDFIATMSCDEEAHIGDLATDEEESCITFERTFEQVLLGLESQNSLLRLGSNEQLLTRIILNRIQEYVDTIDVYGAAITRLNYLLHDPETINKDKLMEMVEIAKLELGALQRRIGPFAEQVIPEFIMHADDDNYHIKKIHNLSHTLMPKCRSLVERCEHLAAEYDRIAGDRTNNVLNILTFITFVITPMQLMTGLYGMNFKFMPEFRWVYGYHYFWIASMSITLLCVLILLCLRRWN